MRPASNSIKGVLDPARLLEQHIRNVLKGRRARRSAKFAGHKSLSPTGANYGAILPIWERAGPRHHHPVVFTDPGAGRARFYWRHHTGGVVLLPVHTAVIEALIF